MIQNNILLKLTFLIMFSRNISKYYIAYFIPQNKKEGGRPCDIGGDARASHIVTVIIQRY